MKKKEVQELFAAVRRGDLAAVRATIEANPKALGVCRSSPPKKDDGQSLLQVALKSGNFAIADYLIEAGAAVNFIEQSEINEWRAPALHDAIRAAVFSGDERALTILRKMLQKGADPNAKDSYDNDPMMRATLDFRQHLPSGGNFPEETKATFRAIAETLLMAGADPTQARSFGREPALQELLR